MPELELRTLGAVDLAGPVDRDPGAVLRAPKRLAVLTYLAIGAPGGFARRDKVLALFWPDQDQERARSALRNLLHLLRRALGDDVILNRGADEVGVAPDALHVDALEFERLAKAKEDVAAAELYGGPFLDGFYASGVAPEFQEWIESHRQHLARLHAGVLERLAEGAEKNGDSTAAVGWWRRVAAQDHTSARVAIRLMQALEASGDRPAAIRHAEIHAALLKEEFDSEPEPVVLDYAERLRAAKSKRRFVRPSRRSLKIASPAVSDVATPPAGKRWTRVAAVVTAAVAVGFAAMVIARPTEGVGFEERDFLLIADVANQTGHPAFDESLDAALTVALRQSRYVNVVPRSKIEQILRRMEADTVEHLDVGRAREVALRDAAIKAVLAAEISGTDPNYLLVARLVDPTTGEDLAVETVTATGQANVVSALDSLARATRHRLGESLSAIAERGVPLPLATTSSLRALELFAAGGKAWRDGQWAEARALWREAVTEDSTFASAYASLGLAERWLNPGVAGAGETEFEKAAAYMGKVSERERLWIGSQIEASRRNWREVITILQSYVRLYPDDADAWYNLGRNRWNARDYEGGIEAFERAIGLNPEMVNAHINLGFLNDRLGDHERAVRAFEHAVALDSSVLTRQAGGVNHRIGFLYVKLGDSVKARDTFRAMLDHAPLQQADGHRSLGLLHMYYGRYGEAVEELREAALLAEAHEFPVAELRNRLYLASAYRSLGLPREFNREIESLGELSGQWDFTAEWRGRLGVLHARAGRLDEARELLFGMEDTTAWRPGWEYRLLAGEIALAEGRFDEGIEALELAYRATPVPETRSALARGRFLAADLEEAADLFRESLEDESAIGYESQEDWILAPYYLGLIAEQRGDSRLAQSYYAQLLKHWEVGDAELVALADARDRLARIEQRRR